MIFNYDELNNCELVPGAIYKGGSVGNHGDDPFPQIFQTNIEEEIQRLGNQGGFRVANITGRTDKAFVVLIDNESPELWNNTYDLETKILTYHGDNNGKYKDINATKKREI